MKVYLETERLILRQFTPEDADNLVELDRDPEVRRYLLPVMPEAPTRADAERTLARFFAQYAAWEAYGVWAAIEKASGEFIGRFIFRPAHNDPEEIEVGYRLKRSAWGQGYATEGTRALLRKGFLELGVQRVAAKALAANAASIRVMEKAGMALAERYFYQGEPSVKYALDRDTYLKRQDRLRD